MCTIVHPIKWQALGRIDHRLLRAMSSRRMTRRHRRDKRRKHFEIVFRSCSHLIASYHLSKVELTLWILREFADRSRPPSRIAWVKTLSTPLTTIVEMHCTCQAGHNLSATDRKRSVWCESLFRLKTLTAFSSNKDSLLCACKPTTKLEVSGGDHEAQAVVRGGELRVSGGTCNRVRTLTRDREPTSPARKGADGGAIRNSAKCVTWRRKMKRAIDLLQSAERSQIHT